MREKKKAICQLKEPTTRKDLRGFLGAAGFCRIWIPNFSVISKPLYEATKGGKEPLHCEKQERKTKVSLLLKEPCYKLPA